MNKKIFNIIIVAIIGISFSIGLCVGRKIEQKNLQYSTIYGQTFYANIESIKQYNDGSFHIDVKGLEVNDINYRGNFTFKVDDNINMTCKGEKIGVSDLKIGDNISITFTDEILDASSPVPLNKVVKIQILNDEI